MVVRVLRIVVEIPFSDRGGQPVAVLPHPAEQYAFDVAHLFGVEALVDYIGHLHFGELVDLDGIPGRNIVIDLNRGFDVDVGFTENGFSDLGVRVFGVAAVPDRNTRLVTLGTIRFEVLDHGVIHPTEIRCDVPGGQGLSNGCNLGGDDRLYGYFVVRHESLRRYEI